MKRPRRKPDAPERSPFLADSIVNVAWELGEAMSASPLGSERAAGGAVMVVVRELVTLRQYLAETTPGYRPPILTAAEFAEWQVKAAQQGADAARREAERA